MKLSQSQHSQSHHSQHCKEVSTPEQEFESLLEIAFGRWISQGWIQLLMLSSLLCLTIALPIWEDQASTSQRSNLIEVLTKH